MQRIICILFFFSFYSNAQEISYGEIDQQSFDLYQKSDWKGLALMASKHSKSSDYYYFNVRVGIAYFNLKDYYQAEKYFTKAVNSNATDFALLYLYWSYLNMGQIDRAEEIFKLLSIEEQDKIQKENNWIESIYIEGGQKKSNSTAKGNLNYLSLNTYHRLSDKISLSNGISTIDQTNQQGEISQFQLSTFPSFYIKNGWSINTGFLYAKNSGSSVNTINSITSTTYLDINNFGYYGGISKQFRRINAELYGYYITQNLNTSGRYQGQYLETQINGDTKIAGLNLAYVLPVFRNKLTIGSMFFSASDDYISSFLYNPYAFVSFSPKIWLKTSYYPIKETFFVDKSAGIFFTNNNVDMDRLAFSLSYNPSKHWQFIGTYSKENIKEISPEINYDLNSIFLGINYKL